MQLRRTLKITWLRTSRITKLRICGCGFKNSETSLRTCGSGLKLLNVQLRACGGGLGKLNLVAVLQTADLKKTCGAQL